MPSADHFAYRVQRTIWLAVWLVGDHGSEHGWPSQGNAGRHNGSSDGGIIAPSRWQTGGMRPPESRISARGIIVDEDTGRPLIDARIKPDIRSGIDFARKHACRQWARTAVGRGHQSRMTSAHGNGASTSASPSTNRVGDCRPRPAACGTGPVSCHPL